MTRRARRRAFASDWPPCLSATTYQHWVDVVAEMVSPLTADEQEDIWSGTAVRAYKLQPK